MQGGIVCVMILGRDGTHGKGRCVWGFVSEPCNSKAFEKMRYSEIAQTRRKRLRQ